LICCLKKESVPFSTKREREKFAEQNIRFMIIQNDGEQQYACYGHGVVRGAAERCYRFLWTMTSASIVQITTNKITMPTINPIHHGFETEEDDEGGVGIGVGDGVGGLANKRKITRSETK
jgi:hypothetical protein